MSDPGARVFNGPARVREGSLTPWLPVSASPSVMAPSASARALIVCEMWRCHGPLCPDDLVWFLREIRIARGTGPAAD